MPSPQKQHRRYQLRPAQHQNDESRPKAALEIVVLTGQRSKHLVDLAHFLDPVPVAPPPVRETLPARQFRFSVQQRQAVVATYRAGVTMAELAGLYGVRRQTIGELLRREGIPKRRSKRMNAAEIDQARQLYMSGLSLKKVGERLGRDHNMIWRQLKKRGVKMRSPSDRKH